MNAVCQQLGIDIPIVQAPMGWIARAQLASSVSEAGGMGIIETSSGLLDEVKVEIESMRERTDRPFGVNIAQLFVRDPSIVDWVVDQGVRFVTTSAGDPGRYTDALHDAGVTVYHGGPPLRGARTALDAGVDGLIVESVEGGGFKNPDGASAMVLLPLIRAETDLPVIAAGGICDAVSMAAALVLGADGVQMGTRMLTAAESPVHDAYKAAVVAASETDTVLVNRSARPAMRALRTDLTESLEPATESVMDRLGTILDLYFGGDMEASVAMAGQVAGRIDEIRPVAEILTDTWNGARRILRDRADAVR
ncbi:MAG: nitronate monooxygenase [Actinomycetota bacterium]